jgi:DNA (cytosine-5)-methyltransferase 1
MLRHVGLFAGLGGFAFATRRQGIYTAFMNDVDPFAVATLKENFCDTKNCLADVRKLEPSHYAEFNEDIDILTAGFPCQSFSQAGDNLGFDDERGKLFFEIPRIIASLPNPPKVVLLENVAHLKSFDNGSRLRVVVNALRKAGYWLGDSSIQIIDSFSHSRSPQKRARLYIVAVHSNYFSKNRFEFPKPISTPEKLLWRLIDKENRGPDQTYLPEGNKYEIMIRQAADENGSNRLYQIRRIAPRACPPNICPTLTANMGRGGHNVPFLIDNWGVRRLSVEECLRLQGFSDGELEFPKHVIEKDRLMMIGNAVSVDVAEAILAQIKTVIFGEVQNDNVLAVSG